MAMIACCVLYALFGVGTAKALGFTEGDDGWTAFFAAVFWPVLLGISAFIPKPRE